MKTTPHAPRPPLQTRDAPQTDLATRTFQVRADSVDEEARTVEGVLVTESPVRVFDSRTWEEIDEVLLVDGVQLPDQVTLLANHERWTLDAVLGSVRSIAREETTPRQIAGLLHFAAGDPDVDRVWNKVSQKHLRDLSVGYRVEKATDIDAGQSAVVAGRTFTAGERRLRVATAWQLKETSVLPIGADALAKTRRQPPSTPETLAVNPKLRKHLESLGLRTDATDEQAQAFYAALGPELRARADQEADQPDPASPTSPPPPTPPAPSPAAPPADPAVSARTDPPDPDQARADGQRAEHQRQARLREMAGDDVPAEILQQAIDGHWTEARAAPAFLEAVRAQRPSPLGPDATPAIHSRSREADVQARSLAAGMLTAYGMDPTKHRFCREFDGARRGAMLTDQDADLGDRLRDLSAVDICRECARIDSGKHHLPRGEAIRAAVSGGTLAYVFGTNAYAKLTEGWQTIGDTTVGWCEEEDVPNFLTQEDISIQAGARLQQLPRGDTAKHATMSDSRETYKIARYAKQFVVDEQDILDDRLGAIMRMPMEMGQAARELRPDLVYAIMLENPTMNDTGAVFNNTIVTTAGGHANLGTTILSNDGLTAGITAIVSQRIGRTETVPGRQINLRPKWLLVPALLEWTGRTLTSAAALAKLFADTSDPWYATLNLIAQEGIRTVPDDRIGAIGVTDPRTEAARTGSATNWFLTAGRGLRVAYRTGTGRLPQMRSFALDRGQWGVGWDIKHDIGAAFTDFLPWYKSTGAGE